MIIKKFSHINLEKNWDVLPNWNALRDIEYGRNLTIKCCVSSTKYIVLWNKSILIVSSKLLMSKLEHVSDDLLTQK